MKRILVAGGEGNLGSKIVKELEKRAQVVRESTDPRRAGA